jgi:hypothetical protein
VRWGLTGACNQLNALAALALLGMGVSPEWQDFGPLGSFENVRAAWVT